MKTIKLITILALSIFLFSCGNKETKSGENNAPVKLENQIQVIDFYGTHRCVTCEAIEANTKYTLDTYFAKELKSDKITFQTINVDEEDNYEMAEKFEAAGTALFLNVVQKGKETPIDLTDFAFEKGREQKEFSDDLKVKIEEELKKI